VNDQGIQRRPLEISRPERDDQRRAAYTRREKPVGILSMSPGIADAHAGEKDERHRRDTL
jgi:hypothetical protein